MLHGGIPLEDGSASLAARGRLPQQNAAHACPQPHLSSVLGDLHPASSTQACGVSMLSRHALAAMDETARADVTLHLVDSACTEAAAAVVGAEDVDDAMEHESKHADFNETASGGYQAVAAAAKKQSKKQTKDDGASPQEGQVQLGAESQMSFEVCDGFALELSSAERFTVHLCGR